MVKPLQARGRLPTEGLPPRRLGDGREQDCAKGEQRSLALQVDCLGACVSSRANGCREGLQIGARVGDAEEERAAAEKEEEWVESSRSASWRWRAVSTLMRPIRIHPQGNPWEQGTRQGKFKQKPCIGGRRTEREKDSIN